MHTDDNDDILLNMYPPSYVPNGLYFVKPEPLSKSLVLAFLILFMQLYCPENEINA